jgi:hypothetical protein
MVETRFHLSYPDCKNLLLRSGLLEFSRRYPQFRPTVICDPGMEEPARSAGIPASSWVEYLLSRPGAAR